MAVGVSGETGVRDLPLLVPVEVSGLCLSTQMPTSPPAVPGALTAANHTGELLLFQRPVTETHTHTQAHRNTQILTHMHTHTHTLSQTFSSVNLLHRVQHGSAVKLQERQWFLSAASRRIIFGIIMQASSAVYIFYILMLPNVFNNKINVKTVVNVGFYLTNNQYCHLVVFFYACYYKDFKFWQDLKFLLI